MVAGYETTTHSVAWLLYQIARHPQIQERIHAEVDEVLYGRTPTFQDLSRLVYTRAAVDEQLRLNATAWITMRRAVNDDELSGYHVPAHSDIQLNFLMMHHHPDFWANPMRFDPQRFLPENQSKLVRNAYLPFGAGPRICIGKHFAIAEIQLIVTMIMQEYRITIPDGHPPVEMDLLITVHPKPTVTLRLERR
jgi:cytochrome P450